MVPSRARTAALNQFSGILTSAPDHIRTELAALTKTRRIRHCAAWVVDNEDLADPEQATRLALRTLAQRIQALNAEVKQADKYLTELMNATAPTLTTMFSIGPDTAAQLLITAGDNPDRLATESSLAHLCGAAPIPASSGKRTNRYRLNRGGDRQANKALYTIALTRMRYDERTRTYVTRRTGQGLSTKEILRCLKRYIAREVYTALLADYKSLASA